MDKDIKSLSKEELKTIVDSDDHTYFENDESYGAVHAYWDCETCDAESELERRHSEELSKLPGYLPRASSNGSPITRNSNRPARELAPGMVAAYIAKPGVGTYPTDYVECTGIWRDSTGVVATWKTTNTGPDEGVWFRVRYELDESINVWSDSSYRAN